MIFYLIKRLILIIPVLFAISIIAFLLIDRMAGDRVRQDIASLKWEGKNHHGNLIEAQKEAIIKKYTFNIPLFYFSLSNKAKPDTLFKVFPIHKRKFIGHICQSYRNERDKINFLHSIDSLVSLYPEASRIYLSGNEGVLIKQLSELQQQGLIYPATYELFTKLRNDQPNLTKLIPVIHWNGTANRYHLWLSKFVVLDFGRSIHDGLPIREKIFPAISISMKIGLPAILILFMISVPLGVYLSQKSNPVKNTLINFLTVIQAMPLFWIAELLLIFLASKSFLYLFPSYGTGAGGSIEIAHMILPIASLVLSAMPIIAVHTKKSFEFYQNQPFILTARSKGISERKIRWKHVFRNAITPIITLFFTFLPSAVAGVMIVEYVYSIPGAGRLLVEAIGAHDHAMILTLLMLIGLVKILSGILADLAYFISDPRVSFS